MLLYIDMQISISVVCEMSNCCIYSSVSRPSWMSMLFHRRDLKCAIIKENVCFPFNSHFVKLALIIRVVNFRSIFQWVVGSRFQKDSAC